MQNKITRRAALAVAGLLLAPLGGQALAADAITVTVIPIADCTPLFLGKAKGFFDEQNLDLTIQTAGGGAEIIPSVISGQRQFGFSNLPSLLIGLTKGLDLVAVAPGASSTGEKGKDMGGVIVAKDSPIQSAKDLVGKTVAVNNLKNIAEVTIRAAVEADGGDSSQVKFVEIPFPDQAAAIASKQVDAGWVVEPFVQANLAQGNRVASWTFVETTPKLEIADYFTTGAYAAANADIVARFQKAIAKSLDYAQAHPDEARATIPTFTRINAEAAGKVVLTGWPSTFNHDSTEKLADLGVKFGLYDKKPDLDKYFSIAK